MSWASKKISQQEIRMDETRNLKKDKEALDALSLTGQQAQTRIKSMEVSSPLKLMVDLTKTNERNNGTEGPKIERKLKTKAQLKKMAREKRKNKSLKVEVQLPVARIKRMGKLIFEEGEESL